MPRFGREIGEGNSGTQRRGGIRDGSTPQGLTGTWVQAKGGKGRSALTHETASNTGTRGGAQGQAVEDGGSRVRAMSRWAALCTMKGGG